MKVADLAVAVASALGLDSTASLKVKNALDLAFAADRKAKDEGGLGPVDNLKKGKDSKEDKAEDDKDDPEGTNDKDMDAEDEDETESDKTRGKDKKAKDKKAKDKKGMDDMEDMDAEDDVQPSKSVTGGGAPAGNAGKEPAKDKKGMDAAIKSAIADERALNVARREVEPVLGEVTYDSAAQVYGAALKKLGVDTAGIDASAFSAMYKLAVDARTARTPVMASDATVVKGMAGAIPGYDRLK